MNKKEYNMIPVYLINGFLEAGKTQFINETVSSEYFFSNENTLIISMEDGECQYDSAFLKKYKTYIEYVDNIEEISPVEISKLLLKYRATRLIIEENIMLLRNNRLALPKACLMNQQITIVDYQSFGLYFNNNDMKNLFMQMITGSELIIFNRVTESDKLKDYLRAIKAVNPNCEVAFEDVEGYPIGVRLDEDLPYDKTANEIEIEDEDYGIWFIDAMSDPGSYVGKLLTFKAQVIKPPKSEKNIIIPGRYVMTCCVEDIQFLGFVAKTIEADSYNNRDWVKVRVRLFVEYYEGYKGEGPVLQIESIEKCKAPRDELVYFGVAPQ